MPAATEAMGKYSYRIVVYESGILLETTQHSNQLCWAHNDRRLGLIVWSALQQAIREGNSCSNDSLVVESGVKSLGEKS